MLHIRSAVFIVVAFLCVGFLVPAKQADAQVNGVPKSHIERLARGINISLWMDEHGKYDRNRIKKEEYDHIRSLGFTHIRLNLDPQLFWARTIPFKISNQGHYDFFRQQVDLMIQADLAVVIDFHTIINDFKGFAKGAQGEAALKEMWRFLSKEFASYDPEYIYFEFFNEPKLGNASRWVRIQGELVDIVRSNAPNNTIIISGDDYSSLYGLKDVGGYPYSKANLVYNFHYYMPLQFTHQCAPWSSFQSSCGTKWPGAGWDKNRLRNELKLIYDWGKRHNVPISVNEWGAYRGEPNGSVPGADQASRVRYYRDIMEIFNEFDFLFSAFEYNNNFGLCSRNRDNGNLRTCNSDLVDAIGMNGPAQNLPGGGTFTPGTSSGGSTGGTTGGTGSSGGSTSGPCHVLRAGSLIPTGFGAPFDVALGTNNLLMQAVCIGSSANVILGDLNTNRYIYELGYVYSNNQWSPVSFTASGSKAGQWIVGSAAGVVPRAGIGTPTYFVSYICSWNGSAWKCGCRDSTCASPLWQLQVFN